MTGKHALMAKLLYGGGLRLLECIRLRIQDVDFGQGLIFVRGGKGGKDRTTILPRNLHDELQAQIEAVKAIHHQDLEEGFGEVYIPEALIRKYPKAARETGWQWVFPARKRSLDPRSAKEMRHHVLESGLQKAVKRAAKQAGIDKKTGCHTLRHYGKCLFMGSVHHNCLFSRGFFKNTSHNISCYLHRFCNQFIKSPSFSHDGSSPVSSSRYALSNAFRFISLSARA
jgi:integrase